MKIQIEKDGVVQEVKERHLQNFLDRGWNMASGQKNNISTVGKANATADIIEEETPQEEEELWDEDLEDEASMPNNQEGDE